MSSNILEVATSLTNMLEQTKVIAAAVKSDAGSTRPGARKGKEANIDHVVACGKEISKAGARLAMAFSSYPVDPSAVNGVGTSFVGGLCALAEGR
jgi:hypothetical protein